MFCSNCGKKNPDENKFCTYCGDNLTKVARGISKKKHKRPECFMSIVVIIGVLAIPV